jgi:hypothetical protein
VEGRPGTDDDNNRIVEYGLSPAMYREIGQQTSLIRTMSLNSEQVLMM